MADNSTNVMQKTNNSQIAMSLAVIVIGILFCAFRTQLLSVLFTVVGAVMILLGVYYMMRRQFMMGLIEVAVGAVIIALGWTVIDITLLLLGIAFTLFAIYQFVTLLPDFKSAKGFNKVLVVLNPIFLLTFGVILMVARWFMLDALFIAIGVIAIVDGVIMLLKATDLLEKK